MATLSDYRQDLEELIDRTLLLMGDPLGERFDRDRVAEGLNDSVLDFVLRTQMLKEEINVQLKADVWDYDIKKRVEEDGTLRDFGFALRIGFNGNDDPAMMPTDLIMIDLRGYTRDEKMASTHFYLDPVSPGRVAIFGHPTEDGEASPSEEDNMQVTFIPMPTYMETEAAYPDSDIPSLYHDRFPMGAASRILEEGDAEDLAMAAEFEERFYNSILDAVAEEYRGRTIYEDVRPM